MKLTCVLFLSFTTTLFAQMNSNSQNQYYLNRIRFDADDPFYYEKTLLDQAEKFNAKSITKTTIYKKNKPTTVRYSFNEFGKISEKQMPKSTLTINYTQDTLISSMAVTGKHERFTTMRYLGTKKVLEETFGPKKLISRTVIQYNANDQLIFSSVTAKKTYSMTYEYEGEKLSNQRFMKSTKIIKEWDYQCKPEGQTIEEKNLSTVCNYVEESNDGSYIKFTRSEEKGKVILTKVYYTKDSVWYKSESFKNDSILIHSSTKTATNYQYTNYDSKGKISSQNTMYYDNQNRLIKTEYANGRKLKMTHANEYTYNDEGQLVAEKTFFKGKLLRQVSYEFDS